MTQVDLRYRRNDDPARDAAICNTCRKPGACCQNFVLSGMTVDRYPTPLHVMVFMATHDYQPADRDGWSVGYPFYPNGNMETNIKEGGEYGSPSYRFSCVNLGPDGRCMDYENRPWGPCVTYKPRQDQLCVEYEEPMSFIDFAKNELARAGVYDPDNEEASQSYALCILELVRTFEAQGHNRQYGPNTVAELFHKLVYGLPLSPLQGTDDEWYEVFPGKTLQNRRCADVEKDLETGKCWHTAAYVFEDPVSGARVINQRSRVEITAFPFMPRTVIVQASSPRATATMELPITPEQVELILNSEVRLPEPGEEAKPDPMIEAMKERYAQHLADKGFSIKTSQQIEDELEESDKPAEGPGEYDGVELGPF